jgi:two-component system, NtrC family, nitrogen regulation sensor histidine kinase NtrY
MTPVSPRSRLARLLFGRTEVRLALVILLTATLPLVSAVYLASSMFRQASALWFNPEVGTQLDRGVDVYKDYVKAVKDDMRHQGQAIAADDVLKTAATAGDATAVNARLETLFPRFPGLVALRVENEDESILGQKDRGTPVDKDQEKSLDTKLSLGQGRVSEVFLVATFAVPRKRLDELEASGQIVNTYHQLEVSRADLYVGYTNAFSALLALTIVVTAVLGFLLARGLTKRIERLSLATRKVAGGDLSVQVPVTGSDELTELARAFNKMTSEVGQARSRIEFLQRMGAWQEMAQRLAHEIKNPLTPIQLAVQECHRKYAGGDARYTQLLDTTLEIVEEEVGTLRRLVANFSNFARLPQAELASADLRDFLSDCRDQRIEDPTLGGDGSEALLTENVDVEWEIPENSIPCAIDRQMFRRVVINLVRNAVQAHRSTKGNPKVRVRAVREGDEAVLVVEDNGPGVPAEQRARVFEPYFTTKTDGTGLGLAIVKKIVVEHGGTIDVEKSPLGGAAFVIRIPVAGQVAAAA